jgi:beta-glucosidase
MKIRMSAFAVALAATAQAAELTPVYKNPKAKIDDRVADLLKRMSIKEKMSQLIQGDMRSYLDLENGKINKTGLEWSMEYRSHAVWTGLYAEPEIIKKAANVAQDYLIKETKLG